MYFPIGLPKCLSNSSKFDGNIQSIVCNRDRILFSILSDNSIWIYLSRPCVPLTAYQRGAKSIEEDGQNYLVEWRPDSSMLVVATTKKMLLFFVVSLGGSHREAYEQDDSPLPGLRRHSAELYTKERIPPLTISQTHKLELCGKITYLVCLRDELMVCTETGHIQRVRWDGTFNSDYCINLSRVPFCDDQLVMKAVPLDVPGTHIVHLEYSPLVGGFAIVLNDGRAAFLTASTLKFDPNAVQGIWAKELDDATCAAINHKYRLLAFGRLNSQGLVMMVDEATGGLEICQKLALSSKDFSGQPGPVEHMRWTPDGTVLGLCWKDGGFSLWSVFGSLLTASLHWDYSQNGLSRPLIIKHMEWGAEGYELWCLEKEKNSTTNNVSSSNTSSMNLPPFNPTSNASSKNSSSNVASSSTTPTKSCHQDDREGRNTRILLLTFIKSAITVNPCMSRLERVLLQGSDRLYLSTREGIEKELESNSYYSSSSSSYIYAEEDEDEVAFEDTTFECRREAKLPPLCVAASKQWLVVPIPYSYTASNWPIRYTCVDDDGDFIGVAGRNGVAHYSLKARKWHLFGNESQEEDLVVTGGLIWWRTYLILGAYSIPANTDQIRLYPRSLKLDDEFATIVSQPAQVLLLNIYADQMIVLTADCRITVYNLRVPAVNFKVGNAIAVTRIQEVDISGLTVHPACVISVGLTSLRTESWKSHSNPPLQPPPAQSIIFNISGKVLMIQRDHHTLDSSASNINPDSKLFQSAQMTPIVLASCCESLWCATRLVSHKPHLSHALWLHCGNHGTRAWLPLFPSPGGDRGHAFMARRIMLPFTPSIYPLAVLFEEAIMIGAETDTSIIACDSTTLYQPLVLVERTSQVYLHHLLRQLLRRNLGYHAWEVANTCRNLPYFPHALELLLHQVLEEEATSKDPIPDSLLPRVLDFIREFPVYLLTIVQCARKTELALWRYLFSVAGSPRHLFCLALDKGLLETAASYLIILQNLESALVSRSHATLLLDATLEAAKWELSKDIIRFLRSIDPNDLESTKATPVSVGTRIGFTHATPPVSPQCADEDLSMIMPNTQVLRGRSFSSSTGPAKTMAPGIDSTSVSPHGSNHHSVTRTISDSAKGAHQGIGRSSSHLISQSQVDNRKTSSGSSGKDVGTAEEYFLDIILKRHAKKLLVECRLRDLGRLAAHLDFPLVSWLRKEKNRAASIEDFVYTLRQVHADFSWPFPSAPSCTVVRKHSGYSLGPPEGRLFGMEDRMHQLSMTLRKNSSLNGGEIGDSGYLSQSTNTGDTGGTPLTPQHTVHSRNLAPLNLQAMNAFEEPRQAMLIPHSPTSGDLMSIMSEEGSIFEGDPNTLMGDWGGGSPDSSDPTRNMLCRPPDPPPQAHPKPPPHAEVHLRYFLQIFLEAGCLELSVILAVVLRDAMAILRAVGLAKSPDTPAPVLRRLVNGLKNLMTFTNTHCLGYQSFMTAVMGQAKVLKHLAESRDNNPKVASIACSPSTSESSQPSSSSSPGSALQQAASQRPSKEETQITQSSKKIPHNVLRHQEDMKPLKDPKEGRLGETVGNSCLDKSGKPGGSYAGHEDRETLTGGRRRGSAENILRRSSEGDAPISSKEDQTSCVVS